MVIQLRHRETSMKLLIIPLNKKNYNFRCTLVKNVYKYFDTRFVEDFVLDFNISSEFSKSEFLWYPEDYQQCQLEQN